MQASGRRDCACSLSGIKSCACLASRRFARALLRGDCERADDLVQDTLERALSSWQRRRIKGDPRGWLYTILYHRFLTDRRRRNRKGALERPMEIVKGELPGVEGGQDSALVHRDLLRAFAILPEEQQSVLLLIAVEDLSYEEAARVLGVPIGTNHVSVVTRPRAAAPPDRV